MSLTAVVVSKVFVYCLWLEGPFFFWCDSLSQFLVELFPLQKRASDIEMPVLTGFLKVWAVSIRTRSGL